MNKRVSKIKKSKGITSEALDSKFDDGESVLEHFDISRASKFVNVEFPLWMVKALDEEASRLGIPRQAVIKTWIDEKLRQLFRERKEAAV